MVRLLLFWAFVSFVLASCSVRAGTDPPAPAGLFDEHEGVALERFASARAFELYVAEARRRMVNLRTFDVESPAPAAENAVDLPGIEANSQQPANAEITNNQTVGVDEGGIVKQIGRFLVVLQDGRLFSADLGGDAGSPLRLADRVDVYRSPATAASWYDEMLVIGQRILVTAYDYRQQASEISVFRIDGAGRIAREGRFLLSSDDYYSTENYATRLVGDRLVFYAPVSFYDDEPSRPFRWPRIRRADAAGEADEGQALIGATNVYAPPGEVEMPVLHTLSICPLGAQVECRTTAFVGPALRDLYVSTTDAFLWVGAADGLPWSIEYANQRRRQCPDGQTSDWLDAGMVYRVPLDGSGIGAVAVDGAPADQFAFDSRDGRFRALLQKPTAGCRPWQAGTSLALLDIPLSAFRTDVRRVADGVYSRLPQIEGGQLENRFIGDWLVYGGRSEWSSMAPEGGNSRPAESSLFAVPLARPADAVRMPLPHNAIRIERAGRDAIVTGYRSVEGLSLSYVSLGGAAPRITATSLLPRRFESEARSHAFNVWMRPDGTGLLGLPTSERLWRSGRGWSDSESSELSFVSIAPDKTMASAGELGLRRREAAPGYRCEVSCVDWYGNSRPIFTGGRIFALMGTELVEGRLERGRIAESGRLDLTGPPAGPGPAP